MESAVTTQQLCKVYDSSQGHRRQRHEPNVAAVDDLTLSVDKGELFGLLGPNGAGKTTLVKLLCTLILPSSGTATVAGHDLSNERAIRALAGLVVSDERSFFWRLSLQRNLDFFAAMHGLHGQTATRRVKSVLKDVDLWDRSGQRFSDLSSGLRQRLAIARAILHEPQILFLDEPTRSLDPATTQYMHSLILRLMATKEMTVFLITHDLAEAEKLCGRIALMHRGILRKIGRPGELRRHLRPQRAYTVNIDPLCNVKLRELQSLNPTLTYTSSNQGQTGVLQFRATGQDGDLTAVIDHLRHHGIFIHTIEGAPPTLEEVFAHYTADASPG